MAAVSLAVAFWIRFEFSATILASPLFIDGVIIVVSVKTAAFVAGGLQRGWWQYAGLSDLLRIFLVNVAASGFSALALFSRFGTEFPRSVYVIDFLICFLLTAGTRFCVRLYNETVRAELATKDKSILIYGAGAAGRTLLREIRVNSSLDLHVVGFIDDNPFLRSASILGVPVLGAGHDIAAIVQRSRREIDEVVIAMPSASGLQMGKAHANCRTAGVPCKTVPGLGDLLRGKYLSAQLRDIAVDDLLGREQVQLDEPRIEESIAGHRVLVTGAAGSIGSELCRQVASFRPATLVLLDQAESELFKIDNELRQKNPDLQVIPVIGDIRDIRTVDEIVRTHSINSIYHAAAYKHVPMMEAHVIEAVRNNIIGTWNLVRTGQKYRISKFLMISSDKAVNPTSVMGTTKRIAELIVGAAAADPYNVTSFVSVRFGNVVGSNGSVVPLFQSQIAAGGPVTVTHPEMRRYFMSIREAVQLVLQASTMGKGSEIFVLDMGEPVRILDLAHNMIQLAGLTPNQDIEVRITGPRPGEKLFEEIALDDENMLSTDHPKIGILKGSICATETVTTWLNQLQLLITRRDHDLVLRHLAALVPEYKPELPERVTARQFGTALAGTSRGAAAVRFSDVANRAMISDQPEPDRP
jgi:FlaA1/EpsC-like NDP-sugar epimerase